MRLKDLGNRQLMGRFGIIYCSNTESPTRDMITTMERIHTLNYFSRWLVAITSGEAVNLRQIMAAVLGAHSVPVSSQGIGQVTRVWSLAKMMSDAWTKRNHLADPEFVSKEEYMALVADVCVLKKHLIVNPSEQGHNKELNEALHEIIVGIYHFFGFTQRLRDIMLIALEDLDKYAFQKELNLQKLAGVAGGILYRMISAGGERSGRTVGEDVLMHLAKDERFFWALFRGLKRDELNVVCQQLLEDLLLTRPMLELSTIPNIDLLLLGMNDDHLASFCCVLQMCMSEADVFGDDGSLEHQNQIRQTSTSLKVVEKNKDFLVALSTGDTQMLGSILIEHEKLNIIERFCRIATSDIRLLHSKERVFPKASFGTTFDWNNFLDRLEWTNEAHTLLPLNRPFYAGIDEPIISSWGVLSPETTVTYSESHLFAHQNILRLYHSFLERDRVLYILGLLLQGKHKLTLQRIMVENGMVARLIDMFDWFTWGELNYPDSSEFTLQQAFVRFIHCFADQACFKYYFCLRNEIEWLQETNKDDAFSYFTLYEEALDTLNMDWVVSETLPFQRGLIAKIAETFSRSLANSWLYVWLARALESFLRGTVTCNQMFLYKFGLVDRVVGILLQRHGPISNSSQMQSSFDLLAELIKFNPRLCKHMDSVVCQDTSDYHTLISITNSNLVDSNMFIRSVILTANQVWEHRLRPDEADADWGEFLRQFSTEKMHIFYTHLLLWEVRNVQHIIQDNVSCLNTALLIFILARRRGEMSDYLRQLSRELPRMAVGENFTGMMALHTMRRLLDFWRQHYFNKAKDSNALQRSSRIMFDEWSDTVSLLCRDDVSDPNCLACYLRRMPPAENALLDSPASEPRNSLRLLQVDTDSDSDDMIFEFD